MQVVEGIHHLKFAVSDLSASEQFYQRAFGAVRMPELDHRMPDGSLFAVLLEFPGLGTLLELRLDAATAAAHAHFDPLTLQVRGTAELEQWISHLAQLNIPHSPLLTGISGWLVVIADPDQRRIRLYTREGHGPELPPSFDSPWLYPRPLPAPGK